MEILKEFDWATAPPMALLAVSLIGVLVFMWRMMLVTRDMQANALRTGTEAVSKALDAFRETQTESRNFYTSKLEDMRAGVRLVEDRMRDLEEQLEDKSDRVEDLERENKRKDQRIQEQAQRITELEEEINVLRKRLDEKAKPKRLTKGKGAAAARADAAGRAGL